MDETDEERVNEDVDQRTDSTIIKLAEQYASLEKRAKAINEEKKQIRDNVDKLGIPSLAWQIGIKTVKLMTKGERGDFQRGYRRVIGVLGERQRELFPEDVARMEKRIAEAKEKAAKEAASKGPDPDTNPRSDPKSGGAGKAQPKTPAEATKQGAQASDAALANAIAKNQAAEQTEGDNVTQLGPQTTAAQAASTGKPN